MASSCFQQMVVKPLADTTATSEPLTQLAALPDGLSMILGVQHDHCCLGLVWPATTPNAVWAMSLVVFVMCMIDTNTSMKRPRHSRPYPNKCNGLLSRRRM